MKQVVTLAFAALFTLPASLHAYQLHDISDIYAHTHKEWELTSSKDGSGQYALEEKLYDRILDGGGSLYVEPEAGDKEKAIATVKVTEYFENNIKVSLDNLHDFEYQIDSCPLTSITRTFTFAVGEEFTFDGSVNFSNFTELKFDHDLTILENPIPIDPTLPASAYFTVSTVLWAETTLVSVKPVPEPATMLLFGTGIAGVLGSRLRKKKNKADSTNQEMR